MTPRDSKTDSSQDSTNRGAGLKPEERLLRQIFGEPISEEEIRATDERELLAIAHIDMAGSPTAGELLDFLTDLRAAYFGIESFLQFHVTGIGSSSAASKTAATVPLIAQEDLVLKAVTMNSPGAWAFWGA